MVETLKTDPSRR